MNGLKLALRTLAKTPFITGIAVLSLALGIGANPTMVVFTGLVSLGTGLLFGMYPALHSTRQDLVAMLKAGGGQPSSAHAATRFRHL